MARVAPDANDVFVLYFNDTGPTHANTGTAGDAGNFLEYGGPVDNATGLYGDALYMPSQYISSNHDGAGGGNEITVTPNITISGWVYVRRQSNFQSIIWHKQYVANGWSSPFLTIGMQTNSSNDGGWFGFVNTSATLRQLTMSNDTTNKAMLLIQGRWYHIGETWDGTTLTSYMNGVVVGTLVPGGGAIDYGTAGTRGQWFSGSVPGSATTAGGPFIIQDFRVANVVRPQSYFANVWYQGMFVNG